MAAHYLTADLLSGMDGVGHGFFTRQGGASEGIYQTLNCGLGSDDAEQVVRTNRGLVAGAMGVSAERLCTVYQIHSPDCVVLDGPQAEPAHADALVTTVPGLALGILTADCCPVLLADAEAGVIGAAHAGWRGAAQGVIGSVVSAMVGCGADRARLRAAIGPTISLDNYEIGPDFIYALNETEPGATTFVEERADWPKPHFNLPAYVHHRLGEQGVTQIGTIAPSCTYAHEELYFSFRRSTHRNEPDYGRLISAIVLQG